MLMEGIRALGWETSKGRAVTDLESRKKNKRMCLQTALEEGEHSGYGEGRKGKLIRTESMSVKSV